MLIVGLGNPGREYYDTRHNAGFKAVDLIADKYFAKWKSESNFNADLANFHFSDCDNQLKILLCKPLLYMNRSGRVVSNVFSYYEDSFYDSLKKTSLYKSGYKGLPLIVLYDELDFEPGTVKIKKNGSAGGHKGVSDIMKHLGRDDFIRIRIGIGHPRNSEIPQMDVSDWVLSSPKSTEMKKNLANGITKSSEAAIWLIESGFQEATIRLKS